MQRAQVRHGAALRVLGVLQQATGGADGGRRIVRVEATQVVRAELRAELAVRRARIEVPGRPPPQRWERRKPGGRIGVLGEQKLRRLQPVELRVQRVDVVELHDAEPAAREVEPCEADSGSERQRRGEARLLLLEKRGVGHGARRDHAHDLARDRAFARRGIADLLADRDRFAELHQAREIGLRGMHGHAGHRNRLAGRLPAFRERDVDELRRAARVVIEELVEVAHPVKQQRVRELRFDRVVLLHDRSVRTVHRECELESVGGARRKGLIVVSRAEAAGVGGRG